VEKSENKIHILFEDRIRSILSQRDKKKISSFKFYYLVLEAVAQAKKANWTEFKEGFKP
jgi:hypothetical protein